MGWLRPGFCALALFVVFDPAVFQQGPAPFRRSQLTWFDRAGNKAGVIGGLADYGNLELSPNGEKIAVAVLENLERATRDIWIVDVANGRRTSFTTDPADENWMIWSRDGSRVVFNSGRNGGLDLYQAAVSATSAFPGEPLLLDREAKWPVSWSGDGRYILYVVSRESVNHIIVLPTFGDRKPFSFKELARNSENWAAFSPDGKWVAYTSTESGSAEVYVSPFPPASVGRKWLVSKNGGSQARWRRDGKELYFLSGDRRIVAAEVTATGSDFEVGEVKPLFEISFPYGNYHAFDVTADGQRFLVNSLVTLQGRGAIAH